MTRTWRFAAVAATLTLAAACNRAASQSTPAQPRSYIVASTADAASDQGIANLQRDLREGRGPARAAEQLGYRFIARARLSNDAGFYKVAEQAAARLESYQPDDPSALLLRGHILHQLHRFGEAEAIARRLVKTREFVLDFGLLGDALMEQGRLSEAADAYQKMIDLKPFYQSYTRAAHLRWLKGDLDGAVRLMSSAVKAASPRDPESIAWSYSRLAAYELQRGRLVRCRADGSGVAAGGARLRVSAARQGSNQARAEAIPRGTSETFTRRRRSSSAHWPKGRPTPACFSTHP